MGTIDLKRRTEETPLDYHKRLIYGKLVDKTLADADYSELAELAYGKQYSSDVARRMFYGSRYTLELQDAESIENIQDKKVMSDIDAKMIELQKERQKFNDQRNAFNKVIRDKARQEELEEILKDAISNGVLPVLKHRQIEASTSDNDLLVSLNDIHFGASYENFWGAYNSDICCEMFERYLNRIIRIAKTHGSENCIIWANGDLISGNIKRTIQISNRENVIQQITGVSELIAEFIAELSNHFKTVKFVSIAGNHSRLDANKEHVPIDERLDDLIEWYLKARLQSFNNVEIGAGQKIDSTMYLLNVRGLNYLGVHGDWENTSSRIHPLQTMAGEPLYAILSGHLHHNKTDEVQGIKTIMGGSFLGMDDYCIQKRIYSKPEQIVCVCDETGVICHYDISLI